MTDLKLKEKCREIIINHLKNKKLYPVKSRPAVLSELVELWRALDNAGLMEHIKSRGWTFQHFHDCAHTHARIAAFTESTNFGFHNIFGGKR